MCPINPYVVCRRRRKQLEQPECVRAIKIEELVGVHCQKMKQSLAFLFQNRVGKYCKKVLSFVAIFRRCPSSLVAVVF